MDVASARRHRASGSAGGAGRWPPWLRRPAPQPAKCPRLRPQPEMNGLRFALYGQAAEVSMCKDQGNILAFFIQADSCCTSQLRNKINMPECDIVKCKICDMPANILFEKIILFKYRVGYFRCPTCEFLFTEQPCWLQEAYDESIKGIRDTGMVRRNMNMSDVIEQIILRYLNPHGVFVDYGAGTGLLVRMMRDKGFKYYYSDPIAKNIFARGFDVQRKDLQGCKFDLLTALEVFEHSTNPVTDLRQMFRFSDSIFFTTEWPVWFRIHSAPRPAG